MLAAGGYVENTPEKKNLQQQEKMTQLVFCGFASEQQLVELLSGLLLA